MIKNSYFKNISVFVHAVEKRESQKGQNKKILESKSYKKTTKGKKT